MRAIGIIFKAIFACVGLLVGMFLLLAIIGSSSSKSLTPEQQAAKEQHDKDWDHDFKILWNVKENATRMDLATKSDISGWHKSVDLTIGSHDARKADVLANTICRQANLNLIDKQWKIRVFFADGSLASECKITN
jgi:hypothetical protein